MNPRPKVIQVDSLQVVYPGGIKAVDGVSFCVREGEIYGLLGPNGAGKTTTITVLTTLLEPTGGKAHLAGMEVRGNKNEVRRNMGYVSQELSIDDELTGWDNLWLQTGLYHMDRSIRKERIEEVLELVDLKSREKDYVATYSGGMRKRLDIACGLVHRPPVLILDEPTLGLDLQTRHEIWRYITRLRDEVNMSILLTTHYMDEADQLCHRIGIIDRGRLVAEDTPANLKRKLGGDLISFSFTGDTAPQEAQKALELLKEQDFVHKLSQKNSEHMIITSNGEEKLPRLFKVLEGVPVRLGKVTVKMPALDDVFLYYTGRKLRDEESSQESSHRARFAMRRLRGGR